MKGGKIELTSQVLDISAQNISQLNIQNEASIVKIVNCSCNPIINGDFIKMFPELQILHADQINAELNLQNLKLQQLILRFNEYKSFPGFPSSILFFDISGNPLAAGCETQLRISNKTKRLCFGSSGKASQNQFSGTKVNTLQLLLRVVACQTINKIVIPEKNKCILGNVRFQIFEDKDKFGVQIKKVNTDPVKNAHLCLTIYQVLTGFEINQISQTDNIKLSTLLTDFRIDTKQYQEFLQYEFPASTAFDTIKDYNQRVRLLEKVRQKQLQQGTNYLAYCVEFADSVGVFLYSLAEKKFVEFDVEKEKLLQHISAQNVVKAEVVSPKKAQQQIKSENARKDSDRGKGRITFEDEVQEEPVVKKKTKKIVELSDLEDEEPPKRAVEEVDLEVYDKKSSAAPNFKGSGYHDDITSLSAEQLKKYAVRRKQEVSSHATFMPGNLPSSAGSPSKAAVNPFIPQQIPSSMTAEQQIMLLQSQQQQNLLEQKIVQNKQNVNVEIDYLHLTPKRVYVDNMIDVSNKRDVMSVIYYITDKTHMQINQEISDLLKFSKHVQSDVAFLQAIETFNQQSDTSITKQKTEMYTYIMVGHAAMKIGLKCVGESIYGIQVKDKYFKKHIVAELKYPWGTKMLFHPSPCYLHIDGDFTMFFDKGKLKTNIAIENYSLQLYHNSQLISQLENSSVFDLAQFILKKYGYSSIEEFKALSSEVLDGAIAPRYDGLYQALMIIRQFDGTIEKEISCTDLLIFGQVGEEQ